MDLSLSPTMIAIAIYLVGSLISFAFHFVDWRHEISEVTTAFKTKQQEVLYLEAYQLFVRTDSDLRIFKKISFKKIWLPVFIWPIILVIVFTEKKKEEEPDSS